MLLLNGCATAPLGPLPQISQPAPGIYHRVKKGETLWRISKIYNVGIDELTGINRISDTSRIETGQAIFIPQQENLKPPEPALNGEDFCWPLKGRVIAGYGQMMDNIINKGINIAAGENANVVAARSGRVVFMSPAFGDFGKSIIIDHGDGYSTLYTRNSQVFIKAGDEVTRGMTIAKVGSAGRDKTKYLHFEIRKGYLAQNPNFYLP
jgi:lipoprotein NlpD